MLLFNFWGKLDRILVPLHADHSGRWRDTPVKTTDLAEHLHGDNMVLCIDNKAHSRTVKTEQNVVARCQRVSASRFAKVGTPTPMRNGIDVAQGLGASGAVEGESVVLLLEQSLCAALASSYSPKYLGAIRYATDSLCPVHGPPTIDANVGSRGQVWDPFVRPDSTGEHYIAMLE
ncbi:unnamed protein product [Trypanosoma congolense IL3000]|uniref:WGS project CAEQ00000000 data, annotated contig 276 n=1 Tax=Trypanosoma congolense (strain IL3000) TaxID=1068625 RepID=F9WEJ3_TRYCI|nr:unnamed protein product [Trypanosoma congolense IL3000]